MQSIQVVPSNDEPVALTTTQKDLILGLLILGHRPICVRYDGRTVTYEFNQDGSDDAARILKNEPIQILLKDVFSANTLWAATLTRAAEMSRQSSE